MLYLTCTTITSVDLAQYGVSRAKDRVSVDSGTTTFGARSLYSKSYIQKKIPQESWRYFL